MKPRTVCGCQSVARMISATVAPLGRSSSRMMCAFFVPARAAGLLDRAPFLRRVLLFAAEFAASVLERLPDAAHGRLAIGEPLDCSCTRKAIPDADQASRRPRFRQLRKLVKAAESVRSLGFVGAGRSSDVIVRIDGIGRH